MQVVKEKLDYQIKEAVIKVIVFFDIFDFPLTSFEIWKYLNIKCELAEVIAALDEISAETPQEMVSAGASDDNAAESPSGDSAGAKYPLGDYVEEKEGTHPNPPFQTKGENLKEGTHPNPPFQTKGVNLKEGTHPVLPLETRGENKDEILKLCSLSEARGRNESETKGNDDTPRPLATPHDRGEVKTRNGFYFLAGRGQIVDTRMSRYNTAGHKMNKAVRISRLFKFIPWIKMIAVGNIMGGNNAKTDSDIDLFIVTENKRVWITRFFCVVITKLLGLRPALGRMKDKICLSFFVSEGAMDLRGLMLHKITEETHPNPPFQTKGGNNVVADHCPVTTNYDQIVAEQCSVTTMPENITCHVSSEDIYFIYWLGCLEPIFDCGGVYKNLIMVNNWIYEFLPNWQPFAGTRWRDAGRPFSFLYRDVFDMLIGGLEKNLYNWQIKILPAEIKNLMNKDSRVVVNENILKFHVNDRRREYQNKFLKSIKMFNS